MDLQLTGKTALVLGGGKGLGAAIAEGLAAEGATVAVASRSSQPDCAHTFLPTDLANPGAATQLAKDAQEALGPIDILVNNTGGPPPSLAGETEGAAWQQAFQSLFLSMTEITTALLPKMRERGFGRILTIASSGVEEPIPGLVQSNAIRAAMAAWSKTLAGEVASDGVTVNMILPGRIETDRLRSLMTHQAERAGVAFDTFAAKSARDIPAGRFGQPAEFAHPAVFVCSPLASYITGTKIRVDGGATKS